MVAKYAIIQLEIFLMKYKKSSFFGRIRVTAQFVSELPLIIDQLWIMEEKANDNS